MRGRGTEGAKGVKGVKGEKGAKGSEGAKGELRGQSKGVSTLCFRVPTTSVGGERE